MDASRIRVIVQAPGAGSQDAVIRIRSGAVVDEPVVSVVLQAICGRPGERRYDFLPEYPADLVPAQVPLVGGSSNAPVLAGGAAGAGSGALSPEAPPAAPAPAPVAAAAPSAPARARPIAARPAAQARPPVKAPTPRAVAAAPRPVKPKAEQPAKAAPAEVAAAPVAGGQPRLTLDAPLRSITALAGPPSEDPAQRADAAAAWRALNAQPGDMYDSQRLQALEEQAKAAQATREKSERDLRARLERAERRMDEAQNNRVDIAVVYGLLALLLMTIAAAAYFWHRARKAALEAANWVQGPAAAPTFAPSASSALASPSQEARLQTSTAATLEQRAPASAAAALAATANVPPLAPRTSPAAASADFAERSRTINPEEFFDVQQHADFFISLGQYDQAIEVLKKHIEEHAEMSPLAFLELFKIYHTLGRQREYNELRTQFQAVFNARIPNFAAFTDEGLGLEDYPASLLSIETAWGAARVLDTIEANIFRHPEDTGRPFDLAALRDLLMLHAVARTILRADAGEASALGSLGERGKWPSNVDEDSAFLPMRLTRPDFSASRGPRPASAAAALAPMAGASASAAMALDLDSGAAPLSAAPSYDHDLVLDLDLSTDTSPAPASLATPATPAAPAPLAIPPLPDLDLDIDLQLLDIEGPATVPMLSADAAPVLMPADAAAKPALDSGLIDFDLFDPNTEARIAPKSTR